MTESIRRALISKGQSSVSDARPPFKNPLEITRADGIAGQKMRRRVRLRAISALALTCGLLASAPASRAAEYAFTTYPLGVLSFGAGITPPPGVYVTDAISFYSGKVGGNFDFGGRIFDAGVKADVFLDSTNILLVPQGKLLDGYFGVSVTVPAGYVKYEASATGPLGNTVSSQTSGGGLGDMSMQVQLGWDSESFSHTIYLLGIIPTGRYETGFSPIIGLNRPSLDLAWAFTYFDKSSKLQINGSVGFMASMENDETQYHTGNEFHAEWAIGYKFDNGLLIGVVGYDYRQLTGDSGSGAVLGPFESSGDAIGPGLSYSTLIGELPVVINVRDYEQYNWKNLFHGNAAIASFTAVFPASQALESAKGMKD
jgi:hypothetical protein